MQCALLYDFIASERVFWSHHATLGDRF